ncbi:MAG: hypothetical protein IJ801_02145 [Lachnospiraceae bacterium]|nr:hypothetical protein [Lachnospiraceae bacterium]
MNFRKWESNYRVYVVLASVLVFTYIRTDPVRTYAQGLGLSVTPYFFSFQMADEITRLLFYFALILLLCDAPFTDGQQMFVLIRTGRRKWFLGQILYIFLASAVYFLVVAAASVVLFIPYVAPSLQWGSVFTACAGGNALTETYIPDIIVKSYTPVQAWMLAYAVNTGTGMLLGLLIFWGNLFRSRIFGPAMAMGWVLFSNVAAWSYIKMVSFISPVSWVGLTMFHSGEFGVTYGYVAAFLVGSCVLLSVLILYRSRYYNIEALEEI